METEKRVVGYDINNVISKLRSWEEHHVHVERPDWDEVYLNMAIEVSRRSLDSQTQCGCVIVNQDNEVVSTGYNSFIRGVHDSLLPNQRPMKYPFMIHAEHNAILNCARQGKSTLNTHAYITARPCNNCFQYLWQAGVKYITYCNYSKVSMTSGQEDKDIFDVLLFLTAHNITVREINFQERG